MLSRGFHGAVSVRPAAVWPIISSSCLHAYLRLCQMQREHYGFSPLSGRKATDVAFNFGVLPAAAAFEVMAHSYMLMVVGYEYLAVSIPIYIFGWILLPWFLDGFRPALTLLALAHALFVGAFLALLGFLDLNVPRALNADLY
ncbi:MAG: hypothetical protein ACTSQV_07150, partial [Alphaproteobacteria bacterium]